MDGDGQSVVFLILYHIVYICRTMEEIKWPVIFFWVEKTFILFWQLVGILVQFGPRFYYFDLYLYFRTEFSSQKIPTKKQNKPFIRIIEFWTSFSV